MITNQPRKTSIVARTWNLLPSARLTANSFHDLGPPTQATRVNGQTPTVLMCRKPWILHLWMVLSVGMVSLAGCKSGPLARDSTAEVMPGPTFYQRMESLRELEQGIANRDSAEQQRATQQLSSLLREEENAMLRAQAVRVLGQISDPMVETALNLAESDVDPHVRQQVCEVRGKQRTREGVRALARIIENDNDIDVRISAARELRNYRDQEAYAALLKGLQHKDPALQRRSLESIKVASGKDLGNDLKAWEQYVATGQAPAADQGGPSFLPEWPSLPRWAALPKLER